MRRTAAVVAGLAALAAVLLAVFSVRAAIAALAISWLCGFGWMVLSARGMSAGLTRLTKRAQRTDTRLRRATQAPPGPCAGSTCATTASGLAWPSRPADSSRPASS